MNFKTSKSGVDFIKTFEQAKLKAYKAMPTEPYYTIGYGHYGKDVAKDMTITMEQANAYLVQDLGIAERAINKYNLQWMNQNRFDALVSFTFNCGVGNLDQLLKGGKRTAEEVSAIIIKYDKFQGKPLAGLTKRRKAEKVIFDRI